MENYIPDYFLSNSPEIKMPEKDGMNYCVNCFYCDQDKSVNAKNYKCVNPTYTKKEPEYIVSPLDVKILCIDMRTAQDRCGAQGRGFKQK